LSRPGIILDRDGTLIDVVRDEETGVVSVAFHPNHIQFLPTVLDGLRDLVEAGFVLGIATNQPSAAKGMYSRAAIERTNQALLDRLAQGGTPIAALEACLHHPAGGPGGDASLVGPCECRKPKPGMLLALIEKLDLDPARTFMIGDSHADVQAARAAGVRAGLVFSLERCELCPLRGGPPGAPDFVASRFQDLVRRLLAESGAGPG
jgi:D-glycero-D-manno-heptose 1,7-bisphosphate phosphatase